MTETLLLNSSRTIHRGRPLLISTAVIPFMMAKKRKLDLSCNFLEQGDSSEPSKISSLVGLPRVRSQKYRMSPPRDRSRYHSDSVTNLSSQIGLGPESSNILRLQLHDLLEKVHHMARSRMTKAQDAVQELRRMIEQIPSSARISVCVKPSHFFGHTANWRIFAFGT